MQLLPRIVKINSQPENQTEPTKKLPPKKYRKITPSRKLSPCKTKLLHGKSSSDPLKSSLAHKRAWIFLFPKHHTTKVGIYNKHKLGFKTVPLLM